MSCECESGGNYECQFNLQNCSSWNSCVCYKSVTMSTRLEILFEAGKVTVPCTRFDLKSKVISIPLPIKFV